MEDDIRVFKGHHLPVTCAVMSSDSQFMYSASKDCNIIKCKLVISQHMCACTKPLTGNVASGKKEGVITGYYKYREKPAEATTFPIGQILALAISSDRKFLVGCFVRRFDQLHLTLKVSGGQDKLVRVWNAEELLHIKNFKGHRSTVTVSDME